MGKKIAVLAVALFIIALGAYEIQQRARQTHRNDVPGKAEEVISPVARNAPEDAIPEMSADVRLFLRAEDTASLSKGISFLSQLARRLDGLSIPGADMAETGSAAEELDFMKSFVDVSREIAVCLVSGDVSGMCISMFVDGEKFEALVSSGDGRVMRVESWDAGRAEGDGNAWIVEPSWSIASDDLFYARRSRIGDNSVVHMATDATYLDAMAGAMSDPDKRLKMERKTEGPNFAGFTSMKPLEATEGLTWNEAEVSWNISEERVAIQWFSDLFDGFARLASRDFAPASTPMMGEGNLAFFGTADPAFFIYAMFPNERDSIKSFVNRFGKQIPAVVLAQFAGDIEAILRQCRISAVLVTKDEAVNTAYLLVDTAAARSVDKLYGLASLFLGAGMRLERWDSAHIVPTGANASALVAKKGGTILVGWGDFYEYERTGAVSADVVKIAALSEGAFGVTAIPRHLRVKEGPIADILADALGEYSERAGVLGEFKDALDYERVENFTLNQSLGGRLDIDITLRK